MSLYHKSTNSYAVTTVVWLNRWPRLVSTAPHTSVNGRLEYLYSASQKHLLCFLPTEQTNGCRDPTRERQRYRQIHRQRQNSRHKKAHNIIRCSRQTERLISWPEISSIPKALS